METRTTTEIHFQRKTPRKGRQRKAVIQDKPTLIIHIPSVCSPESTH